MVTQIFILLVVYQFKHFFADFPLQGSYMLGKFKPGAAFIRPLAAHCGVHAAMTLMIAASYFGLTPGSLGDWVEMKIVWGLGAFDFGIHFIMDRIKAAPHYLGRFKALSAREMEALQGGKPSKTFRGITYGEIMKMKKSNTYFWWCLGFDQMVHHLTHYYIIFRLVTA